MTARQLYPKRPVKAAVISFIVLSIFVGSCLPFQEEKMRDGWPFAFAYCAFLAIASIGLIRLGARAFLLIGVPFVIAIIPGIVGMTLMLQSSGSLDSGGAWLHISTYLLYAVGAWSIYWIVRGWMLYYSATGRGV